MPHEHDIEASTQVDAGRWQDLLPAAASPVEESRKVKTTLGKLHTFLAYDVTPRCVTRA
jgi:hypothetical protein